LQEATGIVPGKPIQPSLLSVSNAGAYI
jgi:hypothetical protein